MNEQQLDLLQRYIDLLRSHRENMDFLLATAGDAPFSPQMREYAGLLATQLATLALLRDSPLNDLEAVEAGAPALHTNGVNGATGRGLPPFDPKVLSKWRFKQMSVVDPLPGNAFNQLHGRLAGRIARLLGREEEAAGEAILGVVEGVNPLNPIEARWGVVFHPDTPQDVRTALQPLIRHRAAQCGYADLQQAVLEARRGEDPYAFRLRHGQGHGDVDPQKLPYYLLLIGPPTQLSWRFQYGLDAQHAVGRLDFADATGYAAYARALIAYESPAAYATIYDAPPPPRPARRRQLSFFAPNHDAATALSAEYLSGALLRHYQTPTAVGGRPPALEMLTGPAADKAALHDLLTRSVDSPALVFTATHGLYFPREDVRQPRDQGALLCPGPRTWPDGEPVPVALFFGADDIQPGDRFDGLLLFAFGCYTAGTPVVNDFPNMEFLVPDEIAAAPFTARLAQRLLEQGALAVVGHVERAWHFSFAWQENAQIAVYRSLLDAVLKGQPLGHAMEYFNARFLDVNHHLTTQKVMDYPLYERDMEYFELWAARNDARGFVLLGDPLVRAPMDSP